MEKLNRLQSQKLNSQKLNAVPQVTRAEFKKNIKARIDYYALARDFFHALRSTTSQRLLSQKLGYKFNQVSKWELGLTQIRWQDFIEVAEVLNIPIEHKLRFFFGNFRGSFEVANILNLILNNLALTSHDDLQLSQQIKRTISKKRDPDLGLIFRMLDTRPSMLMAFLMLFTDCSKLESIKKDYAEFLVRLNATMHEPRVVFVNAALRTKSYAELELHDEILLAKHAACSLVDVRRILKMLIDLQIIHFDGKKYYPCPFDFSFSNMRHPKLRGLTKYVSQLAAEKYPLDPETVDRSQIKNACVSSVRVTSLSQEAAKKVDALVARFHSEVSEVIQQDSGVKEHVQIILLHSFVSNIESIKG